MLKKKLLSAFVSGLFCAYASAEHYTMMTAAGFPPFSDYGVVEPVEGFDIDLLRAIGKEEGFTISVVIGKWSDLFKQLDAGNADILRGIYYSEKRAQDYLLTSPYFLHETILLTKSDNKGGGNNAFQELIADKKVSILHNSLMYESMKRTIMKQFPDIAPVETPTQFFAFKKMMMGQADYVYFTREYVSVFTRNYPQYQYQTITLPENLRTEFKRVFPIRKDNEALYRKIESGLKKVHQNGEYDRIYRKYFGHDESMKL